MKVLWTTRSTAKTRRTACRFGFRKNPATQGANATVISARRMAEPRFIQSVDPTSFWSRLFFWMSAAPNPWSINICVRPMYVVARAMTPKLTGPIRRATTTSSSVRITC